MDTKEIQPKSLELMGQSARDASRILVKCSVDKRNQALVGIAESLEVHKDEILSENRRDCELGQENRLSDASLDRLLLTEERIEAIAKDVRTISDLPDPLSETFDVRELPNGLTIGKRRVPLGVIGAIYESRPNVTVDISALCLKSGNACIMRGGSEAVYSNRAFSRIIRRAISEKDLPLDSVQLIENPDRALVGKMLRMNRYIDLLIPRGGAEFIRFVVEGANMPVVTGGVGVCHMYIDKTADINKAVEIAFNAKVQRPTVCNALDALLVHYSIAPMFLPAITKRWADYDVEMHCDKRAMSIIGPGKTDVVKPASDDDWGREFLSLTAAVKIVDSIDESLEHITEHGGHSDVIITEDYGNAMRFLDEVDSAVVYVNASTRFTDGAEFGLGAEVGISTQKLHARGPMGLKELTSYKWIVFGDGQTRS